MIPLFRTRRSRLLAACLAPLFLALLLLGPAPAAVAQDEAFLYLPVIQSQLPDLYGTVTYRGAPMPNITIQLWRYSTVDPVLVATTRTDAAGVYRFAGIPRPAADEVYSALFDNLLEGGTPDERFVAMCSTPVDVGREDVVHLGDFDIDNILQTVPPNPVKLPYTFTWTHTAGGNGSYTFYLNERNGSGFYRSPDLPGVLSFKMSTLPDGIQYGRDYLWFMGYQTDEAYCSSLYSHVVQFKQ